MNINIYIHTHVWGYCVRTFDLWGIFILLSYIHYRHTNDSRFFDVLFTIWCILWPEKKKNKKYDISQYILCASYKDVTPNTLFVASVSILSQRILLSEHTTINLFSKKLIQIYFFP